MRLVSYSSDRGPRAGVLNDDDLPIDAWELLGREGAGLRELLAAGLIAELREATAGSAASNEQPIADFELLAPIPDPEKIICVGLNYRAHAEEAGIEPPSSPAIFGKYRNALVGDDATVPLPAASSKVDFEAEVAIVIGARAKQLDEASALEHVAGYTLLNDLSARDLQFATPQWMAGKVFDGSAPCGPAIVTADEVAADAISFEHTLNGELMQSSSTADLIFSVPELVSKLSHLMTLEPGDVIATGTPSGVGSTRDPRVWLKPGDQLEISSPQLGRLVTRLG